MSHSAIAIASSHPYAKAVALANLEIASGAEAATNGNAGRARVCGRRAVGIFLQTIGPQLAVDVGSHAMANLRFLMEHPTIPDELREASARLLGGARSIASNGIFSSDPLSDAAIIINYFVSRASP